MPIDVLVVDDDPDIRGTIAELLQDEGYDTRDLGNPSELEAVVRRDQPKLILLDLTMPGFDLAAIFKPLNESGLFDDIVVLALSGREDLPGLAAELGLDGAVKKPFEVTELLDRVASVCGAKAAGIETQVPAP